MKRIPDGGLIGVAALREAATGEFRQIMELVQAALLVKLGIAKDTPWMICVEAMFADRVIIRRDGRFWGYAFTLSADNQVQLGDAAEVIEQYVPVALREALGAAVFLEAKEATGAVWDVVIIRSGASLNGNFYPDAVLREAAPLFEGVRVFAKADLEHVKAAGGPDINKLAGWIAAPRFVEGKDPDSGYLAGTLNLTAGAKSLRDNIVDAWQRGKRNLVGLSIDAVGTVKQELREAKRVRVARAITKVNSVDLIVEPGAGGALVRLVEAANPENEESSDMKLREKMLAAVLAAMPATHAKLIEGKTPDQVDDDALEAAYREAVAKTASPAQPANNGLTREEAQELVRMTEARGYLRSAIAGSGLPKAAQERLRADWDRREKFTEADVDAAIKGEREYVARFTESGRVQMPFDAIEVEDRSKKVAVMLDAFFDPAHKDHRHVQSFKECYIEVTGDRRVTGRMEHMDRTRLTESLGEAFRESLDSTSLAEVLGDSIARRLLADYRTPNQYDIWQPLVNIVPVSDFRTNHRTRFGGYGDLPTVAQGAPYAALTSPGDEEATYAVAKKGGTEDLTLEMIKNDEVGVIRQIPIKLGRAAKRTLSKFVLDFLRTNPTLYDSVAFFHATHANLGSAALDATSLAAARLRMLKQTEAGSSERLGIPPKNLVVAVDLQEGAVNLFNRNTNLDKTFVNSMSLNIIPVWYWTDTNDWVLGADPMDIPSIEIGFLDGNQEPELFVQDQPNVGSMFTNDKVTYKIRHIFGGQVVNFRGYDKSVVA